jgi:hypothetical protein
MKTSTLALVCCGLTLCLTGLSAPAASPQYPLSIRLVDSATGYAIQPESVTAHPHQPRAADHRLGAGQVGRNGRAALALESGRHTFTVVAPGYQPMSGDFQMSEQNVYTVCFVLDPLQPPPELQPDSVASLRRPDATLVQGFVADEDSGQPLSGVRVLASPSGGGTYTDGRGFFRFYLPAGEGASAAPASLLFEAPGYQAEERFYVEHAPGDAATYRIRLSRGGGKRNVDERQLRRLSAEPGALSAAAAPVAPVTALVAPVPPLDGPVPQVTAATNSTVRVPRNIRVLESDGVTIDYVSMDTYAKHVLPAEWINSWGATTGGTNSLNAGAVAVRCYAIAKINSSASGSSTYDICGTSFCQNYGANTYTYSDNAVNYTANWVLLSGGSIASTEYSAENNSQAFSCGDGFTEPNTTGPVCIYDPVCTGKTRSGHGRGMCQWGSDRWSIGTLGYPRRDWQWILRHYYPTLSLVKGSPLLVGDDVKSLSSTLNVRACTDGSISSGVGCPVVTTKAQGATGTIIGGPTQVTGDGYGFTWYQIQWSDGVVGWSVENYLERVFSAPTSPSNLAAAAEGTNRINLSWTDTSGGVAASFSLERAMGSGGPWVQFTNVAANLTTYADLNLYPGSTWYYRVRAYNAGGYSGYSSTVSATTSNPPPVLAPITLRDIVETTTLSFTNSASTADSVQLITDFEPFASETANGVVMFRNPRYSSTTSAFLGSPGTTNLITAIPDFAAVADAYPTGHGAGRVLRVSCQFTNPTNPWLLLTTAGATTFPNPVIDFTRKLRFDIYCDRAIKVAVGCRETTTAAGTAIGYNGGTTGAIEWAGVTNVSGTAPMPTRTVAAGTWTTLTFDFPHEPIRSYSGGNGVLSTASGLGVLEHLALVPAGGTGIYNIYLDNFAVVGSRTLTYSLGAGAPANATLNSATGVFTWTPTEAQGPGTYNNLSVVVADNSTPALKATNYFNVTVRESNSPPVLAAIANRTNYAGSIIAFTNSATDPDLPANLLSYSLCCGAPARASLDPVSGSFLWPTTEVDAGTTNSLCVCVTDNGTPPLTASQGFFVVVLPRPAIQSVSISGSAATLTWTAIPNTTFQVQYKDRLADVDWLPLGAPITPTGSIATAVDPDFGAVPQRFYRLLVQ